MDQNLTKSADDLLEEIKELEPLIRSSADEAERERRLSTPVAHALRDIGCYRMFRPRSRGGLEFDPVSAYRVIEELARIDSAAGWNIAIANAGEPFGAWFSDEATEAVFGQADIVLCGAFNPPRRAVPDGDGYRLSGATTFNSNCYAANWGMGLAHIYDDGEPRMADNGAPETLITLFPMAETEIVDNWDTLGMRGTGSHDVYIDNLFVPADRAVPFGPMETPSPAYGGPIHRMTVWPAVACNAVSALGVAQATIDEFVELAGTKTHAYTVNTIQNRSVVQLRLARAEAILGAARSFFHTKYDAAYQTAVDGEFLSMQQRADCQQAASHAVLASAEAVDLIHTIAGTSAIRNEQSFQRHFRDAHVITQHAFVCETRLEAVGQVRLGMDPDWPFFFV